VTPDPAEFGYSTKLNDMPKPAFLNISKMAGRRPSAGAVSLNTTDQLDVEIPIKLPGDYPSNRTLEAWVFDEASGATARSARVRLDEGAIRKRPDGVSLVEISMPGLARPGSYMLAGKLTAQVTDDKGTKEQLASPVTCSTDVVQPVKSRSCRLLSLKVQAR
jgi:hypothetical protein